MCREVARIEIGIQIVKHLFLDREKKFYKVTSVMVITVRFGYSVCLLYSLCIVAFLVQNSFGYIMYSFF